jgi:endonuclease/exonuclease/phosphatase family metal-dependent hydrolase
MKKVTLLLVLVAMFGVVCAQKRSVPLNAMTFNIRWNNPDDKEYQWPNRKDLVAGVISKYKIDIFGMQEALADQIEDLNKLLPKYKFCGVGRDDGKQKGEFSPIFYDSTRFEKLAGSTFWLSEKPDVPGSMSWKTACTRIVTWAKFKDFKANKIFFVFNTHFDHQSKLAQQEAAKLLLVKIVEIAKSDLVIVTGDFNVDDQDPAYKFLIENKTALKLLDTKTLVKKGHTGPEFSYVGFPYSEKHGNAIDHIFVMNKNDEEVAKHETITYNNKGFYPSDHLPVWIKLVLKVDVNTKFLENTDPYMR